MDRLAPLAAFNQRRTVHTRGRCWIDRLQCGPALRRLSLEHRPRLHFGRGSFGDSAARLLSAHPSLLVGAGLVPGKLGRPALHVARVLREWMGLPNVGGAGGSARTTRSSRSSTVASTWHIAGRVDRQRAAARIHRPVQSAVGGRRTFSRCGLARLAAGPDVLRTLGISWSDVHIAPDADARLRLGGHDASRHSPARFGLGCDNVRRVVRSTGCTRSNH